MTDKELHQQVLLVLAEEMAKHKELNEEIHKELSSLRTRLALVPVSIIGVLIISFLLYSSVVSEMIFVIALVIFLSPFYPEAVKVFTEFFRK